MVYILPQTDSTAIGLDTKKHFDKLLEAQVHLMKGQTSNTGDSEMMEMLFWWASRPIVWANLLSD